MPDIPVTVQHCRLIDAEAMSEIDGGPVTHLVFTFDDCGKCAKVAVPIEDGNKLLALIVWPGW